jgi:hypothetical protein
VPAFSGYFIPIVILPRASVSFGRRTWVSCFRLYIFVGTRDAAPTSKRNAARAMVPVSVAGRGGSDPRARRLRTEVSVRQSTEQHPHLTAPLGLEGAIAKELPRQHPV